MRSRRMAARAGAHPTTRPSGTAWNAVDPPTFPPPAPPTPGRLPTICGLVPTRKDSKLTPGFRPAQCARCGRAVEVNSRLIDQDQVERDLICICCWTPADSAVVRSYGRK